MQDAEHAALGEQRHPDQRLEPLLAQDRVQDVGAADVVEHDRPLLGGDTAGEASSERDPDAALDLLLEALRRARHELSRLLVEQQDRHSVPLEDVADALEQLVEHRVERQVRERRVGDEQELAETVVSGLGDPLGHGR